MHEWGTLTSVQSSEGKLLPGLHHEEEDLPGFVADRLAQAGVTPEVVEQKMETPVTYFYAPTARTVAAKVGFPQGIFTQWFPYVRQTLPRLYLADPANRASVIDPWISSAAPIEPRCAPRFAQGVRDGLLDWGEVEILAPGAAEALPGPLGDTTWGFARRTAANPLRVRVGGRAYHEKFLFYRGLGNFSLPVAARVAADDVVTIANADRALPMKSAFLLNVTRGGAAFTPVGDLPAGGSRTARLPAPTLPPREFVAALRAALEGALVADGLYADEARAMVDTWERSYFLTPGPRLLYLLPQAHTDRIIPLSLAPAPDRTVRTMVIRVELLTPAAEAAHGAALAALAARETAAAARQTFLGFGRFAEPYLARAIERSARAEERDAGRALLAEIQRQRRWAPLAVE